MDKEAAYACIEEADKAEIMEFMDTVMNRFRELFEDQEMIVITLPKGEGREASLSRAVEMLRRYGNVG